ncbi:MAG: hypothetical protein H6906_13325 [Hyphomicrobiales bacterium]|nr:hypothetical protein [Hyphomicrobiales bacterium]
MAKSDNAKRRGEGRVPMSAYFGCRVCWLGALVVFLGILAIEAVLLYPSYIQRQGQLLAALRQESVVAVNAGLGGAGPPAADRLEPLAKHLIAVSSIVGVSVFTADDTFVMAVGEHPRSTLDGLKRRGAQAYLSDDGRRYEVFLAPAPPDNPYQWLLTLDSTDVDLTLRRFLQRLGLFVLIISAAVCAVVMVLTSVMLFKPMLRIRRRLRLAMADPQNADRYVQNSDVGNEIGDVDNTLDELLYQVSRSYQEDLAVSMTMVQYSPVAVVAYDGDGAIVFCNAMALKTFGCDDAEAMAAAGYPRLAVDRDGPDLDLPGGLAPGRRVSWGYLRTPAGPRACVFGAGNVVGEDGRETRRFLNFLELEDLHGRLAAAEGEAGALRGEVAQLRQTLNQCLTLLDLLQRPPLAADGFRPVPVQRPVADWIARRGSQTAGLDGGAAGAARRAVRHDVLPFVLGDPDEVALLVGGVLDALLPAAGDPRAVVTIRAEAADDGATARLVLDRTLEEERGAHADALADSRADSRAGALAAAAARAAPAAETSRTLALAIVARLLPRLNGRLLESRFSDTGGRVVFTLPAAHRGGDG